MKNIQCLACGTITSVEEILPGQSVCCNSCGNVLVTRSPNDSTGKSNLCSYCGTEIADQDPRVFCPDCSMEYHAECWEENEGCATYGCSCGKEEAPKVLPEMTSYGQHEPTGVPVMSGIPVPSGLSVDGVPMPSGEPEPSVQSAYLAEIAQKIAFVILYMAGVMLTFGAVGILLLAVSLCLFLLGSLVLFTVSFFFLWGENIAWYIWLGSFLASLGYLFLGYCLYAQKEKPLEMLKKLGRLCKKNRNQSEETGPRNPELR